jgi:hypothetical protein
MKRLSARPAALLVALLLGASTARAGFYSDWSYTLGLSGGPTFDSGSGNSTVSFALNPNGTTGVQNIPIGNLTSNSSSATADPVSANYALTIGITDTASNTEHNFTWQAAISGSVAAATTNSNNGTIIPGSSTLQNVFGQPLNQSFTLGNHVYTVSIDPNTSPAGTNAINGPKGAPVLVDADVSVSTVNGNGGGKGNGGGVSTTPEPSALVLAGFAVTLVGLRRWRKGPAARPV